MVAVSFYLAVAVVFLTIAYLKFFFRIRREGEPPLVSGHVVLGSAVAFGKNAVQFLHKTRKSVGDIFTIRLLNQHITMVLDPHCYERFAKEKNFSFEPIQKKVNWNVFGFRLKNSHKMIGEVGKKVNGRYISMGLETFAQNLNMAFEKIRQQDSPSPVPDQNGNTTGGTQRSVAALRRFTAHTIFSALFYTIFGRPNGVEKVEHFTPEAFHESFEKFHKYFNYLWLGFPVNVFRSALEALKVLCQQPTVQDMISRKGVSDYIKFSTRFMVQSGQTYPDIIGHNLVYLHVNYNTFRVNYWCLYYLLEHKHVREALQRELADAIEVRRVEGSDEVRFTMEEFDHLPVLDSFLKETIRMTSGVFMVRIVMEDTSFTMPNGQTYRCRKGDGVAMYPPTIHMDPEIFEEPQTFKYDRFVDAKFYKYGKELTHPLVGFGSICPGKRISQLQIKWYLMNFLNTFDMELKDGARTKLNYQYYGQEILPPIHDVQVLYTLKTDAPKLVFVPRHC